jgi:hypothetical protein
MLLTSKSSSIISIVSGIGRCEARLTICHLRGLRESRHFWRGVRFDFRFNSRHGWSTHSASSTIFIEIDRSSIRIDGSLIPLSLLQPEQHSSNNGSESKYSYSSSDPGCSSSAQTFGRITLSDDYGDWWSGGSTT